ncbi:MAG: DNA/RNA nuclease SfsA [Gammaproteobacteria bacterium]|nr:DNA/RNA nuclease SfsA [Gammaproteobacteria bacterium]
MKITQPCVEGRLIKRYKRFLADIELLDGRIITAHTPNTGSMKGCADPGSRVWVYDTQNPARKYIYSWDLVEDAEGHLVGIHTGRPNYLVREAIESGVITELQGYKCIKLEAKYFDTGTRFDLLLTGHETENDCFVEVKNVTAKRSAHVAIFPDAVTKRGQKHLVMLEDAVTRGYRAAMVYCIQRDDVTSFSPAFEIDPDYANALIHASENGVEAYAYKSKISPEEVTLMKTVEVKY